MTLKMNNKTENIKEYRRNYYKENKEYLIAYSKWYYLKNKRDEKCDSKKPKFKGNSKFNKKNEPNLKKEEIKELDGINEGSIIVYFD